MTEYKTHEFPLNSSGVIFSTTGTQILVPTEDIGMFKDWASTGFAGVDNPEDLKYWLKSRNIEILSLASTMLLTVIASMLQQGILDEEHLIKQLDKVLQECTEARKSVDKG